MSCENVPARSEAGESSSFPSLESAFSFEITPSQYRMIDSLSDIHSVSQVREHTGLYGHLTFVEIRQRDDSDMIVAVIAPGGRYYAARSLCSDQGKRVGPWSYIDSYGEEFTEEDLVFSQLGRALLEEVRIVDHRMVIPREL